MRATVIEVRCSGVTLAIEDGVTRVWLPSDECMKEYLFAVTLRMLRYALGTAGEVSSKEEVQRKTAQVWHALYGVASAAQQAVDQKK